MSGHFDSNLPFEVVPHNTDFHMGGFFFNFLNLFLNFIYLFN